MVPSLSVVLFNAVWDVQGEQCGDKKSTASREQDEMPQELKEQIEKEEKISCAL